MLRHTFFKTSFARRNWILKQGAIVIVTRVKASQALKFVPIDAPASLISNALGPYSDMLRFLTFHLCEIEGAEVDARNDIGDTALVESALLLYTDITTTLIAAGAPRMAISEIPSSKAEICFSTL